MKIKEWKEEDYIEVARQVVETVEVDEETKGKVSGWMA